MMKQQRFQGDKKLPMNSLLGSLEKRLIAATVRKFPGWIEGYHLTMMTLLWSCGLIGFGYLAQYNRHWLWLSSLMIFLQWFTDSYDGALGRFRDTGIPKWGYYMDHLLDYLFLCSVMIGCSFQLHSTSRPWLYVILLVFIGFMINSFLSFAATNEFKITFLGCGPTEMRLFFILINTAIIFFGAVFLEKSLPVVLFLSCGLFVVVTFRTQKYIWQIDMRDKASRE